MGICQIFNGLAQESLHVLDKLLGRVGGSSRVGLERLLDLSEIGAGDDLLAHAGHLSEQPVDFIPSPLVCLAWIDIEADQSVGGTAVNLLTNTVLIDRTPEVISLQPLTKRACSPLGMLHSAPESVVCVSEPIRIIEDVVKR